MKKEKKKKVGKPPHFKTEEEFKNGVKQYSDKCEAEKKMPNIAGFASFHGIDRTVYYDYAKKYPNTKRGFEAFLEDVWVQRLGSNSPTGAIFYLKNAFRENYKDRHETDLTSKGEKITGFNYLAPNEKPRPDNKPRT